MPSHDDMAHAEAILAVTEGIQALFRRDRDIEEHEKSAYLTKLSGWRESQRYTFVTFVNGAVRPAGAPSACFISLAEAVECSILNVALAFPNHANDDLVWRLRPEIVFEPRTFEQQWIPSHLTLRFRCVSVPAGLVGDPPED